MGSEQQLCLPCPLRDPIELLNFSAHQTTFPDQKMTPVKDCLKLWAYIIAQPSSPGPLSLDSPPPSSSLMSSRTSFLLNFKCSHLKLI